MSVESWLKRIGLEIYAELFAREKITPEQLPGLDDSDLRTIGIEALGDRRRILDAIRSLPQDREEAAGLPSILAMPLQEYRAAKQPVLRLWHACDFIEMLMRLLVFLGLADLGRRGMIPEKLLRQLRPNIEEPTFGKWRVMVGAVAARLKRQETLFQRLPGMVSGCLVPLLDGPATRTPDTSFTALRNALAHGGGVSGAVARKLVDQWDDKLWRVVEECGWIQELDFVARHPDGGFGVLRGDRRELLPYSPVEPGVLEELQAAFRKSDQVAIVTGATVLTLWPLAIYGVPRSRLQGDRVSSVPVPQVFMRRGDLSLQFSALGSEEVWLGESDATALDDFLRFFQLQRGELARREGGSQAPGFERELERDAEQLVGREAELTEILRIVRETPDGVLWLAGTAGIGKSFVMARVWDLLAQEAGARDRVLPYRFKGGHPHCSRESFLQFAVARLAALAKGAAGAISQESPHKRLNGLLGSLEGRRVVFLLDGLDEIAELDPGFAAEVPLALAAPGVVWVCAGRPEQGLPQVFSPERCRHVFPQGLPPMRPADIRTMILEKVGLLRKYLISRDQEKDGEVGELGTEYGRDLDAASISGRLRDAIHSQIAASDDLAIEVLVPGREWLVRDRALDAVYQVERQSGKLLILGEQTVNPFIERVVAAADGLPLYIKYVISDIQELGKDFEQAKLPKGLAAYHELLLQRHSIGDVQQALTPLVCTLAIAREPLTLKQLAEVLWRRTLATSVTDAETLVEHGTASVASMLRRSRGPEVLERSDVSLTLYHHSLRQFILESPRTVQAVGTARQEMCRWAAAVPLDPDSRLFGYLVRQGVSHLLEEGRFAAAVTLLSHLFSRTDLSRHIPRDYLTYLAKLLSLALVDCREEQAAAISPGELARILVLFYEVEPLYGGVDLLFRWHRGEWSDLLDLFLGSENFVLKFVISQVMAKSYLASGEERELERVVALAHDGDFDRQELGLHALKQIYAERPERIDWTFVQALAQSGSYVVRGIVGELLLNLALAGRQVDHRVEGDDFWLPVWEYNRIEVDDILGIERFRGYSPGPGKGEERPEVAASERRILSAQELRESLRSRTAAGQGPLRDLLDGYFELPLHLDLIRSATAALAAAPELGRLIRLLFLHPSWPVRENAAATLSSIAESRRQVFGLIQDLFEDGEGPVRYGALETAFSVRVLDDHDSFFQGTRKLHRDPFCLVRGLCAENLTAWILYGDRQERRAGVERFRCEIEDFLQDEDIWPLREVHHLIHELWREGFDVGPLLAGELSPLLQADPGWYKLERPEFIVHLERQKRAALGRSLPDDAWFRTSGSS